MAIPTWRWTDDAAAGDAAVTSDAAESATSLRGVDLDGASDTFETLADPTRLSILATLAGHDGPLSYTDLQASAGVEDNGRLNYHLRRLDGLVTDGVDGYELTDCGETLFRQLVVDGATVQG